MSPTTTDCSNHSLPRLYPVMLVGTGSDVGKSVLATGLCRIFLQDGYHPAPFKAQNMALNSYATPDGKEIGRAQAVQAEAAELPPETDMNPVLLKPNSEHTTQVVLNGKPIGNRSAYEYFRREGREELRQAVCDAFDRLESRFNPIVLEGAGSVSEINLRDSDLVNMPMARHADARVILVADIDRGGVFASAYGSIMLQTPEDRQRICGIIVNKFRGDLRLFEEGKRMLEDICGVPVLGVVPMFKDIDIDEEDSVALERKRHSSEAGKVNIAVVLLRHISNFTDFNTLERDPRVNLFYTDTPADLQDANIIILPGTKSTLDDLLHLRRSGMAQAILQAHDSGKTVIGICGGYQMLGKVVSDPDGIEGSVPQLPGLGLLPIETTMCEGKTTRQVEFAFFNGRDWSPPDLHGYEIHQGKTEVLNENDNENDNENENGNENEKNSILSPLVRFADGSTDGCYTPHCFGTYVHGILDNPEFTHFLILSTSQSHNDSHSLNFSTSQSHNNSHSLNFSTSQPNKYDLLAQHLREHLDIPLLYKILTHD